MIGFNKLFQRKVQKSGGLIYLDICIVILLLVCLVAGIIGVILKKDNKKQFKTAIFFICIISVVFLVKIFFMLIRYS